MSQGAAINATGARHSSLLRTVLPPTFIAGVVSALAFAAVWQEEHWRAEEMERSRIHADGSALALKARERILAYGLVLRGAAALFAAHGDINRTEWQTYVEGLTLYRDYPGILGVGYAKQLAAEEIKAHEARVRAEGLENYHVWPITPGQPATAITYLEPRNWRNERAYGYDMYSEPVRREAMDRAAEHRDLAMSGPMTLVQEAETDVQRGVILYLPVYAVHAASEFAESGRLQGWVYSPFRMNDLIAAALDPTDEGLRLRIFDGDGSQPRSLLYDSASATGTDELADDTGEMLYRTPLLLAGRLWTLEFERTAGGVAMAVSRSTSIVVGCLGLLLTIGAAMLSTVGFQKRRLALLSDSLKRSEEQYAALVKLSREGICSVDGALRFTYVNPRLAQWLKADPGSLIGKPCTDYWRLGDSPQEEAGETRYAVGEGRTYEARLGSGSPDERIVLVSDRPIRAVDGSLMGAMMVLTDITDRQLAAERMLYLATHDVLTGIANRMALRERLSEAVALARRYERKLGVLFIDLDHFKEVNDAHGHQAGDRVLIESVKRIKSCLRGTDTLGRLGGDEFMVILPAVESLHDIESVANKIIQALEQGMELQTAGEVVRISASIGLVLFPDDGEDEETLIYEADAAMYRAKCSGRGRVARWAQSLDGTDQPARPGEPPVAGQ
jgi:diguanylate cyclase (GGDEF)-like protein/PAS domain S-box-containing protein